LKPIPGIVQVLPRLGVPYCVASSGTLERIRHALDVTGLLGLFEPHLFSAAMVARGKPAPDLFLHAAATMGAIPQNCLVVEDSPAGIEAARAAGMRVLAFTGGSHAGKPTLKARLASSEPDFIFADMLQLPDLIAGLGARVKAS
jgi:beta-phosphoglucomutase-like phosphatase (HAD superfamily)